MFNCHLDRRSRIILTLGNLCLFSGLMISLFATHFALFHHTAFNFLRFGLALAAIFLNFVAVRRSRRRSGCQG